MRRPFVIHIHLLPLRFLSLTVLPAPHVQFPLDRPAGQYQVSALPPATGGTFTDFTGTYRWWTGSVMIYVVGALIEWCEGTMSVMKRFV